MGASRLTKRGVGTSPGPLELLAAEGLAELDAERSRVAGASDGGPIAQAAGAKPRALLARRLRAAFLKRSSFAWDSWRARCGASRRLLFPHHEGREAQLRSSLRWSGHEVVFDQLTEEALDRADLVVPLDTHDVVALEPWRDRFAGSAIPLPALSSVELCEDKRGLLKHLRAEGFGRHVTAEAAGDRFPYVLKTNHGFGSYGVWIIRDEEQARSAEAQLDGRPSYTEEFLSGSSEVVTHVLRREGRVAFALELVLHYGRKDAVKNQDRVLVSELRPCRHIELYDRMLESVDFEGLCCFNAKERAGEPVVFEINPRLGASLAPLFHRLLRFL